MMKFFQVIEMNLRNKGYDSTVYYDDQKKQMIWDIGTHRVGFTYKETCNLKMAVEKGYELYIQQKIDDLQGVEKYQKEIESITSKLKDILQQILPIQISTAYERGAGYYGEVRMNPYRLYGLYERHFKPLFEEKGVSISTYEFLGSIMLHEIGHYFQDKELNLILSVQKHIHSLQEKETDKELLLEKVKEHMIGVERDAWERTKEYAKMIGIEEYVYQLIADDCVKTYENISETNLEEYYHYYAHYEIDENHSI